jgi:hypothetical protein
MFKTTLAIAGTAIVALVLLRLFLGVVGGVVGLAFSIAWFLLKIAIAAAVVYFVISWLSPETAKKIRRAVVGDDVPKA